MKNTKVDNMISKKFGGHGFRLVDETKQLFYGNNLVVMICFKYFIIKVKGGFQYVNTNQVSKDFNGRMYNHLIHSMRH